MKRCGLGCFNNECDQGRRVPNAVVIIGTMAFIGCRHRMGKDDKVTPVFMRDHRKMNITDEGNLLFKHFLFS